MTNYCSMSVSVDGSLVLELTPQGGLDNERTGDFLHCDVDLLAPSKMRLLAHVQQLGISSVSDHSDRLQLYDANLSNTRLTPIKGLYGRLDTSLSTVGISGRKVKDYKTSSNKLKVDYLGKPTKQTPGFRLIITAFKDPSSAGKCPPKYYHCRRASVCVTRQVVCDGNPNCGRDDTEDERECATDETVTSLFAEYSLTRDIIVVILLPVVVFLTAVSAIYVTARHYVLHRIEVPEISAVYFTAKQEGHVKIAHKSGVLDPPTYQDILDMCAGYEPPPMYNQLASSPTRSDACIEVNSGRGILKPEDSKLLRECELCGRVMHDFRTSVIAEETNYCRNEGNRLHIMSASDTEADEELKTGQRTKTRKGKIQKKIQDNEKTSFINETKPDRFREDSQNSLTTSCVLCCGDQCRFGGVDTPSHMSQVTRHCRYELADCSSTQPHQNCHSHCQNHTQPHEDSYNRCLNSTQPLEDTYNRCFNSIEPHEDTYNRCFNSTQPQEDNYNQRLNSTQPHEDNYN